MKDALCAIAKANLAGGDVPEAEPVAKKRARVPVGGGVASMNDSLSPPAPAHDTHTPHSGTSADAYKHKIPRQKENVFAFCRVGRRALTKERERERERARTLLRGRFENI